MSRLPLPEHDGGNRYPGFSSLSQARHWDVTTAGTVTSRVGRPPDMTFFTPSEESTAHALMDQLLDQHEDPRVPVVNFIDLRLASNQTDGWRYADLPDDGQAWRQSLAGLDDDARDRHHKNFSACSLEEQQDILEGIHRMGHSRWRGLDAGHIWSMWLRYGCVAFYSHPWAWDEIGFPGPAFPRGYKDLGLDRREPFEVPDARPHADPVPRSDQTSGASGEAGL